MSDLHSFGDGRLSATVAADGAELQSLRDASGVEWMWQAGPEWPRRSPVLFPIVGRLAGDTLRHEARAYRLTQHGFARDRRFEWIAREETGCRLRLTDDADTRAVYPFAFVLELSYAVTNGALSCEAQVSNPDESPLLFSIGAHPAFAWPLPGGGAKEGHAVVFGAEETGPARRATGGLIDGTERLTLENRQLRLTEELFADDALVLLGLRSRRLRYQSPAGPALDLCWENYGDLGLWTKPGADFLCLEPWCGYASPLGWDGELAQKPGVVNLEGGGTRRFRWDATPGPGTAP